MSTQTDEDLRAARAVKARFDRGERDYGKGSKPGPLIIAMAVVAVVSVFATLDPFSWFSGPPATADARGQIRAASLLIAAPLFLAWFALVRPLQTGIIVETGGRWASGRPIAVLRSDEPSRFWFIWWFLALALAASLGYGVYGVIDGVRKLRESNPPPNKSLQATRDGRSSSASRFTSFGPACLSSGRWLALRPVTIRRGNGQIRKKTI